ncbi:MAG: hypothetical protein Q9165_004088 [Trypethelium subeluteriae]
MSNSIQMQSNNFGFGPINTSQSSVPPPYGTTFAPLSRVTSFPGGVAPTPAIQPPPNLRNRYSSTARSPMVKSETISPIQRNQMFYDTSPGEPVKLPSPAGSDKGPDFSTDVDTLMKTIQSQSKTTQPAQPQHQQPVHVPKVSKKPVKQGPKAK